MSNLNVPARAWEAEQVQKYAAASLLIGRLLVTALCGLLALPFFLTGGIIYGIITAIGWWLADLFRVWGRGRDGIRLVVSTNSEARQ